VTQPSIPESIPTTFDELCEPIDPFLEQHERNHTLHHREKLHFRDFVKKLVYHFAKGCESGRQLLTDVETSDPELSWMR
jgi:hypothetical protein